MTTTLVIVHTNFGAIKIELNNEGTPLTTENFLKYVDSKFYNGTIFHRIIKGFMIQGGGFDESMQQKKMLEPIENEAKTGLKNEIGTIAMARTSDPHSATSQFFINVANNTFLNFKHDNSPDGYGYCAFGKVVAGIDVINKLSQVATGNKAGHQDVPLEAVVIESIERVQPSA